MLIRNLRPRVFIWSSFQAQFSIKPRGGFICRLFTSSDVGEATVVSDDIFFFPDRLRGCILKSFL